MKKQKNATRVIAIVLVLLMALALIPIAASAEVSEITFYVNGGTIADAEDGVVSVPRNTNGDGTITLPTAEDLGFSYPSYSFIGWGDSAASTSPDYEAGSVQTFNAPTELYALWGAGVTLNPGYGTGTATTIFTDVNGYITLPDATVAEGVTFTKENCYLLGWDTDIDAAAPAYAPGNTQIYSNTTLYAIWQEQYTVSFDLAGGNVGGSTTVAAETVDVGNPQESVNLPSPVRTGYKFAGWKVGSTDTILAVTATTYQPSASVTLTAQWDEDLVPVSYSDGNGHTADADPIRRGDSFQTAHFSDFSTFEAPASKVFSKWSDGTNEYGEDASYTIAADSTDESITFIAQYVDACKVSFVIDGSTVSSLTQTDIPKGSQITLPKPTRSGYTLDAWYNNAECSSLAGEPEAKYTVNDKSKTLYGKWVSNTIPVTFDHGTGGSGTMEPATAPRKGEYTLPVCTFTPGTDMAFVGWKINGTGEAKSAGAKIDTTPYSTGDDGFTLVAQWKDTRVAVTFDPNGGTGPATAATQIMSRNTSNALTKFSVTGIHEPENKAFIGWSRTSGTANTVDFTDEESVKWDGANEGDKNYAAGDTVTLYAVWQDALSGSVTVDGGTTSGGSTTYKSGDVLTAVPHITAPDPAPTTLYYKWILDPGLDTESVVSTSATYTVGATALGRNLQVNISGDPAMKNTLTPAELTLTPHESAMITLTVKLVGGDDTSKVTVNGSREIKQSDSGESGAEVQVVKDANATVTVEASANQQVKSVMKGSEAQSLGTSSYSWKISQPTTVTVTFEAKSETGEKMAVRNDGAVIPNNVRNAFNAKISGKSNAVFLVSEITACYDGNVSRPIAQADIPAAGLPFTLLYPAGSDKVGGNSKDISTKMTSYWDVTVWHWNGTALVQVTDKAEPQAAFSSGVSVTKQTEFSPYGVVMQAKKLSDFGTVIYDKTEAAVGSSVKATFKPTNSNTPAAGKLSYQWQLSTDNGTTWTNLTTDDAKTDTYTPRSGPSNRQIRCVVTSDFEEAEVNGAALKISDKPTPKWERDIVNNGGVHTGIIKDVTADMQWAGPSTTQPGTGATWHDISGTSFEVTQPGYYWVRMKTDTSCENVSKSVYVANYYTVTCHPDSVSTNRLYFEATSTGTVAGVNGVTLADHPDLVRPTISDKLYWVKEGGKGASIYARTLNTNYYKITAIKGYPTVDSTFSKTGKSDYLYIAVSNKYTTQPYDIWASAGVYGSKTGDNSHLGLWMELACISLMGLCAAAVFGRRKLKKQ